MQIFDLPKKSNLAYLDCQYFHNDPKPGVAEHIIKVQYRTKRGEPQSFVIPITCDQYRITRIAKNAIGIDGSKLVKAKSAMLRDSGIPHYFGFRLVSFVQMAGPKKRFKKKSDANTQCWVYVHDDNHLEVELLWAGETINVHLNTIEDRTNDKQSWAIGRYDAEEELLQAIETRRNGRSDTRATIAHDQSREESVCNAEATTARSGTSSEPTTVRQSGTRSRTMGADQLVASIAGNGEADRLCTSHQIQLASQARQQQVPAEAVSADRDRKPARSFSQSFKERARQYMVDRDQWGVWAPEEVSPTHDGLGTRFRF